MSAIPRRSTLEPHGLPPRGSIRWRAENDKIGLDQVTPTTQEALEALGRARRANSTVENQWIFPAPGRPSEPFSRHLVRDYWKKLEKLAGLEPVKGMGWHSLRRKFATELKEADAKTLCALGGWKSYLTILKCYQHADEDVMKRGSRAAP